MYSSVHGTTGAAIMIIAPNPIGAAAAFVSHFIWDYVGESSIGNTKKSSIIEGSLLLIFLIASALSGNFWLALIGWIMGNLPDLIDKPMNWFLGKKQWFSCHNGVGLFQYKGRKLGWPIKYKLTKNQTLAFNIGSTLLWVVWCFI
jgi:hypothetical protein